MCPIAKHLLAEKLIDDFYEDYARRGEQNSRSQEDLLNSSRSSCQTTSRHFSHYVTQPAG